MLAKAKDTKGMRPSRLSLGGNTNGENAPVLPDIVKCGFLRKLKTMKKKFFLLRMDSDLGPARLEYYDSEKKWRAGLPCKRSIVLKTCFNINKKMDSKQKFAIAMYTKDDCFAIVLDSEPEMDDWLSTLLALQQGHSGLEGDLKPKPNFEHVWQVNVKSKGLGSSRNISGTHRLCLTSKSLSLVKMNASVEEPELFDFPLMSIRRCGHSDCFFFMELGRSSVTGAGELWMQTEDTVIAQNMHEAILGAMKSSRDHEDFGPLNRPRSASTSENSKPLATRPRPVGVVPPQPTTRDRCDSMPSRSRTVSEGHHDIAGSPQNQVHFTSPRHHYDISRLHSGYSQSLPPVAVSVHVSRLCTLTMTTSGYSDSAGSSLSMEEMETDFHHRYHSHSSDVSVHTEPTITEEALDDYLPMTPGAEDDRMDYMQMAPVTSSRSSSMFLNLNPELGGGDNFSNPSSPTNDDSVLDMAEGYIPMSPVGSMIVDLSSVMNKNDKTTSLSHRDGYVPMAPVGESSSRGGYMEMTSLSSSLPKCTSPAGMELASPTHSSHSLQDLAYSCSPSAGPKLEEFHLDKVKSYFPPSTEDGDDYIKPVRAYSIGSRPQLRKNHLSSHLESFRTRAYSFGSQVGGSNTAGNNFHHPGIEAELGSMKTIDSSRTSGKSNSAPLLPSGPPQSSSRSGRSNAGGRGDDLMEIVYASTSSSSSSRGERVRTFSHGSSRQHSAATRHHHNSVGKGHTSSSRAKSFVDNSSNNYMAMDKRKSEEAKKADSRVTTAPKSLKNAVNSGDYVNLEMSGPTWPAAQKPAERTKRETVSHNYINLQLGSTTTSTAATASPASSKKNTFSDSDYSDYTMMSPGNSESGITVVTIPDLPKSDAVPSPVKEVAATVDPTPKTAVSSDPSSPPPELLSVEESDSCGGGSSKTSPFIGGGKRKSIVDGAYENILIAPGSASSSRPSSVSSERELNYASLDLAPGGEDTPRSPRTPKAQNSSPPDREFLPEAPLSYAEIDFTKSEGLRHTSGTVREGRV